MPTLFRPDRPYPLPPDAQVVDRDGERFARVRDGGRWAEGRPAARDGTKYLKPAAKWCADVRQADGTRRRVRLSPNKAAAQVMLAELLKKIENRKAGLHTPFTDHQRLPLRELLADYRRHHQDKGNTPKRADQTVRRCEKAFAGYEAVQLSDLDSAAAEKWLGGQRKARGGLSPQTHNHYVTALKAFGNWLVAARKAPENPFRFLTKLNVEVDVRRVRRPLSADEFARLLAAAAVDRRSAGWAARIGRCCTPSPGAPASARPNLPASPRRRSPWTRPRRW